MAETVVTTTIISKTAPTPATLTTTSQTTTVIPTSIAQSSTGTAGTVVVRVRCNPAQATHVSMKAPWETANAIPSCNALNIIMMMETAVPTRRKSKIAMENAKIPTISETVIPATPTSIAKPSTGTTAIVVLRACSLNVEPVTRRAASMKL